MKNWSATRFWGLQELIKLLKVVIFGMNGVAVARNGLILWENDATGSRKVFRWLRGLWDTIKKQKWLQKSGNGEMTINSEYLEYSEYSPY